MNTLIDSYGMRGVLIFVHGSYEGWCERTYPHVAETDEDVQGC